MIGGLELFVKHYSGILGGLGFEAWHGQTQMLRTFL